MCILRMFLNSVFSRRTCCFFMPHSCHTKKLKFIVFVVLKVNLVNN